MGKGIICALLLMCITLADPPHREFLINLLQDYTSGRPLDVSAKSLRTKEDIKTWMNFARTNQNALQQIAQEVKIQEDLLPDIFAFIDAELKPNAPLAAPQQPKSNLPAAASMAQPLVVQPAQAQPKGLQNTSANCFMNSALQALFSLDSLSALLLKNTPQFYHKDTMAYNYVTLLSGVRQAVTAQYDPSPFCVSARVIMKEEAMAMGDSNEFITILLNSLVEDAIKRDNSVRNLLVIETYQFLNGIKKSENIDYILNIQNLNRNNVSDSLNDYFSLDTTTEGKTHQLRLLRTSRYFIVGIKRTGFDKNTKMQVKIDTPVSFPITNLDLNGYKAGKQLLPKYDLKAIIMHEGEVNAGHYTAYLRSGQQWYYANDSVVAAVPLKQIEELSVTGKMGNLLPTTFFYESNQ